MIIRLNGNMIKLVNELSKDVAGRLDVSLSTLCIATSQVNPYGSWDSGNGLEICFETSEDDTYAALYSADTNLNLTKVLDNFLDNKDVVWMKRGNRL